MTDHPRRTSPSPSVRVAHDPRDPRYARYDERKEGDPA